MLTFAKFIVKNYYALKICIYFFKNMLYNYAMKIVLASASPRRRELLSQIITDFDVASSNAEESVSRLPWRTVMNNAVAKGAALSTDADIVISADTGVFLHGKFYGKPADKEDACRMLKRLNGKTHSVWTGVAVFFNVNGRQNLRTIAVRSRVRLDFDSDEAIRAYVDTGSPLDKAGAYGIQDDINSVCKGSFTNVIGLPVEETRELITRAICAINSGKEAKC